MKKKKERKDAIASQHQLKQAETPWKDNKNY